MGRKVKVVIGGISGKMGRASAEAILKDSQLELVGGFASLDSPYAGKEIGHFLGIPTPAILISNGFLDSLSQVKPDVYLDFTRAEAAVEHAKLAIENGICPVIGTSGIGEREAKDLSQLAQSKGIGGMIVPNFSVGAVLMIEFARQAGLQFANVEVVEMHSTKKIDAPSGTAMYTVSKLASTGINYNVRQTEEKELLPSARGAQGKNGVRVHSLRLPGLISHQEVIFGSEGELLTIRHDSYNTICFVKGILMSIKAVLGMKQLVVGLEHLLFAGN